MTMRITCLQIDVAFGDPEINFTRVKSEFQRLFQTQKPDVVVLPELWSTGYDLSRLDEIADDEGQKTQAFLSTLAKKYHTNIVSGSIAKKSGNETFNTMYVFDRNGLCQGEYSKTHLFQLMNEHLYLSPGQHKGDFTIEGQACAGFICYDLRFPEWIRKHTVSGAEVLFIVAEWPLVRLAHWRTLLISRAIENQCYVVACNRTGTDPKNKFAGHSMIVDPWGEVVVEAGTEPIQMSGDIHLGKVSEARKKIPLFQDRRPELY
ncbi:carbon-nitrogen family hydrolase [Bacillus sp. 2205SS5-2]|uniref:carbon-nitrogen family hydrolase n=1 Tax=Bacillus sp. 2205SS5-2 TaxID=3109031 RepID=UPI00300706B3